MNEMRAKSLKSIERGVERGFWEWALVDILAALVYTIIRYVDYKVS